jgi:hypothetical protein
MYSGTGHERGTRMRKECTLTIDVLLQNDRKRAKQRLFKRRQGRWGAVYDEPVHARQYCCRRLVPRTHRINAEMLSKIY